MDCVFCNIINEKIKSKKLFENEHILAFYDVDPKAPTHFLVICKKHVASVLELKSSEFVLIQHIFEAISNIVKQLKLNDGFRIVNNCGIDAGQTVNHLHFHVLANRKFSWPPG